MLIQSLKEGLSSLKIKRIVQKINRGLSGQLPCHCIGIDTHDVRLGGFILEPFYVVHGRSVQRRRILDAYYFSEWEMRRQQQQFAFSRSDVDEKIIIQINIESSDRVKKLLAPKWTIYVIALQRLKVGDALRIEKALLMSLRTVAPIIDFVSETLPPPSQTKYPLL
jgi:hypothetical protein